MNEKKGLLAQIRAYFGLLPGETLQAFAAEMKALTHADKIELADLLTKAGYPCDPPLVPPIPGDGSKIEAIPA